MPADLLQAVVDRRAVIFAGAGVSTEDKLVTRLTMYDDLRTDPSIEMPADAPFPDVMARFEEKYGRSELLQYILKRFDTVRAMPEAEKFASRFHQQLAPIPQLDQIYTTNWDTYFERYTRALPIVTDADFAFWDLPRRKVFKLHGSIDNVSTIIATAGDYTRRIRELSRGLLGATLRLALGTKTVIFVGYSLRDSDFSHIYRYLARNMGDILPRSYIVTLGDRPLPSFVNSKRIHTDGTYFMAQLKLALVRGGHMLSENRFPQAYILRTRLERAADATRKIDLKRYPTALYATCYQDGLRQSLDRAASEWNSGNYHDPGYVQRLAHDYLTHWLRGAVKARRYDDAAYIEGFGTGFGFLLGGISPALVPLFYLPGLGTTLFPDRFRTNLLRAKRLHKAAYSRAARLVSHFEPGLFYRHSTELLGVRPE